MTTKNLPSNKEAIHELFTFLHWFVNNKLSNVHPDIIDQFNQLYDSPEKTLSHYLSLVHIHANFVSYSFDITIDIEEPRFPPVLGD